METKRFLTTKETAAYLDIPQQTLYQLTTQRKITYYRCGKRSYFDIEDIYAYITRNKIPAGSSKRRIDGNGHRPKAADPSDNNAAPKNDE